MGDDKFDDIPGVPAFSLTDRDKQILSSTDEEHGLHTWDELKTIICALNLLSIQLLQH